jgi:nucleoside-diphosphate-sugar epimerase
VRIFLAGATGAIGRPLVARLLAEGHTVVGTTRDARRAEDLRAQGAEPVVLDAFDADAVRRAVADAEPEVLIHQLTALPHKPGRRAVGEGARLTGRLRRETVPAFLDAARAAGARRAIVQSIAFVTRPDGRPVHDEDAPLYLDAPPQMRTIVEPVRDMEASVMDRAGDGFDALVLRYGFFYGPGTWHAPGGPMFELVRRRRLPMIGDGAGRWSFVHIDDAAEATVLALQHGRSGVYNICDDDPVPMSQWLPELASLLGAKPPRRVPAWAARLLAGDAVVHYATRLPGNANGRAKQALGWRPRDRRTGFAEVAN